MNPQDESKEWNEALKNPEQIVELAIQKAVKNGFDLSILGFEDKDKWQVVSVFIVGDLKFQIIDQLRTVKWNYNIEKIIYSKEFAQAFWDEEKWICLSLDNDRKDVGTVYSDEEQEKHHKDSCTWDKPLWKYCLQEMVISKNPIAYLAAHLD